ncbi:DUF4349 domain-containing protein [Paenibacillus glacialis]|uniref:DUF4349 domain-containing protein n=1 Tax=Paenibacillus glacialis TaxID=494026 RepID=A0A168LRB0_9BACL|nr:DUF4349 domain-containing protein [Paenibacillus glacialis]OAB43744.1 hypothetical protein PGLA_08155 [Paenibacillus glacialis]
MRKRGFICILLLSMLLSSCSGSASNANQSTAKAGSPINVGMEESLSEDSGTAESPAELPSDQENTIISEKDLQSVTTSTSAVPVEQLKGFNGASTAEALNKKLIYTANLVMRVKNYATAQSEVRNLASLSGGYIVEFSEDQSTQEVGGTFVLKVPVNGFSSLLDNIEKIKHESLQQSIKGQDVSEEYVDLESRLKVKELMEKQYTEFMKKATKTDELVSFANELGKIQEDIELVKGRMRYINNNVSYSTVEIRLYQQDGIVDPALINEEKAPLFDRANDALKGTINALTILFQWIVVILFGASPIILVAIIVWIVLWLIRRNRVEKKNDHNRITHYRPVIETVDEHEIKINNVQDSSDDLK